MFTCLISSIPWPHQVNYKLIGGDTMWILPLPSSQHLVQHLAHAWCSVIYIGAVFLHAAKVPKLHPVQLREESEVKAPPFTECPWIRIQISLPWSYRKPVSGLESTLVTSHLTRKIMEKPNPSQTPWNNFLLDPKVTNLRLDQKTNSSHSGHSRKHSKSPASASILLVWIS